MANEEPVKVLEEEFTWAERYLRGISQMVGTKEDLRQGRENGEALREPSM